MSILILEHVVLFKVKDNVAPSEADAMVDRINSLASLEQLLHLTVGPLLRIRTSPSLNFTHFFHTRFNSKDDLHAYVAHPAHVAVVKANAPLVDDAMALDWLAEVPGGATVPPPGSALRVTFFKLKEGVGEHVKDEVVGAIRGIQREFQFTCGENLSPARAKGFSIASLEVFPGLSELEAADSNEEIKEHLESVMVLDYVIPSSSKAHSAS